MSKSKRKQRRIPQPRKHAPAFRVDGWENVITGVGTSRDKRTGGRVKRARQSINRECFEDLFVGDDMAAVIAELPALEMTRAGVSISIDAENNEGKTSEERADTVSRIMSDLRRLNFSQKLFEAEVWARVFGGSIIFMGINDGATDLTEPVNMSGIRSIDFLKVYDRFDMYVKSYGDDPTSEFFGEPLIYQINTQNVAPGVHSGVTYVHASRVIRLDGVLTTRNRKRENNGWSDSVYTRIEDTLRDFNSAWDSAAHLVQDFAQAIFRIQGLADALSSDDEGANYRSPD